MREVSYPLDFRTGNQTPMLLTEPQLAVARPSVPRIARLMALAIRFDGLLREKQIGNYAELARLGRVTRARITQIMQLLDLAPDLQEQILFLPSIQGLNEKNLRPIVSHIDWNKQRRLFRKITGSFEQAANTKVSRFAADRSHAASLTPSR